jgi:hypothetical protein
MDRPVYYSLQRKEQYLTMAIAEGKTKWAERSQLGVATGTDETFLTDRSRSGWTRADTFKKYLDWLAKHSKGRITPTHRLHLISDRYSVHRSAEIKRHAAALEMKLWFIPGAHTDELQPFLGR